MPVPDLADPRAPYLQIADDLRRQINAGRYKPGDRLPSNKAMAGEYSTSTETVRRALRVLTDAGLIGAHSTLGTFVLNPPAEAEPDPASRLEAEMRAGYAKLSERIDYIEAQVMALGGAAPGQDRDVGT